MDSMGLEVCEANGLAQNVYLVSINNQAERPVFHAVQLYDSQCQQMFPTGSSTSHIWFWSHLPFVPPLKIPIIVFLIYQIPATIVCLPSVRDEFTFPESCVPFLSESSDMQQGQVGKITLFCVLFCLYPSCQFISQLICDRQLSVLGFTLTEFDLNLVLKMEMLKSMVAAWTFQMKVN